MDLLTHLFLPVTVAYVLRPDLFPSPRYFTLAGFAVLSDLDKLLGLQGALHSFITLGVFAAGIYLFEQIYRGEPKYAGLITAFLFSHLLLDFLDGGPVTVLYPFFDVGIGLRYPAELLVGGTVDSVGIRNPMPTVHVGTPNRERVSYHLLTGYGVLSGLAFIVIYLGRTRFGASK